MPQVVRLFGTANSPDPRSPHEMEVPRLESPESRLNIWPFNFAPVHTAALHVPSPQLLT